jgi:hypothetical protein
LLLTDNLNLAKNWCVEHPDGSARCGCTYACAAAGGQLPKGFFCEEERK